MWQVEQSEVQQGQCSSGERPSAEVSGLAGTCRLGPHHVGEEDALRARYQTRHYQKELVNTAAI